MELNICFDINIHSQHINGLVLVILIVKHGPLPDRAFVSAITENCRSPKALKIFKHCKVFPNKCMLIKGKIICIKPEVIAMP